MNGSFAQITKVISGGQTGADAGGIRGAHRLGIETGGFMPFGFFTEDGPNPEFAKQYGLFEYSKQLTASADYAFRTGLNVFDSDGTLRIASQFQSRGEICTLRAIMRHNKPYFDVKFPPRYSMQADISDVIEWIRNNDIHILNVAGNRESSAKGIGAYTEKLIFEACSILKTGMTFEWNA